MTDRADLLGTWKMMSRQWEIVTTGELDVLGPDPTGYINYGVVSRKLAIVISKDLCPRLQRFRPTRKSTALQRHAHTGNLRSR